MQADRQHHPPLLESAEIVVGFALMFVCWFAWYVARERYHLTSRQLAELAIYLSIFTLGLVGAAILWSTRYSRREREWPHPPVVVPRKQDERIIRQAWKRNAIQP